LPGKDEGKKELRTSTKKGVERKEHLKFGKGRRSSSSNHGATQRDKKLS